MKTKHIVTSAAIIAGTVFYYSNRRSDNRKPEQKPAKPVQRDKRINAISQ
jgi:hypothetical protein